MSKNLFYIVLSFGLLTQTACLQSSEANSCYSDEFPDKEKVFTKMLNKPHYKGGHDSLVSFLSANIDLEAFIDNISQSETTYTDTARIKFIVNKQGGINKLSVYKARKKEFIDEVSRVIKKSSCNWVAGGAEQPSSGWHQLDIYYSIEKPSEKEAKTRMTINEL